MDTLFTADSPSPQSRETEPESSTQIHRLSKYVEDFLSIRERSLRSFFSGENGTIRVSEVLGTIAHLYERIRNIVEYKSENVVRRSAIERISKRLLWERSSHDAKRLSHVLIRELIWGRYLPNDAIPKRKIEDVSHILNKYLYFLAKLRERGHRITSELHDWTWGIASCELEEELDPTNREPYVQVMYEWIREQFEWREDLTEAQKQTQLYLAVHRALTKSDDQIMRYHLLVQLYPEWKTNSKEVVDGLIEKFFPLKDSIEQSLAYPKRLELYRFVRKHTAPFEILRELVDREGEKARAMIENPQVFELKVREICQMRYAQISAKVRRGIVRSIVYIFVTKVIFALLIEVPYELYRFGHLTPLPLTINSLVPPAMMLFIGLTIKTPGETNTIRLLSRLKSIVYHAEVKNKTAISLARIQRGSTLSAAFAIIYAGLFALVFGGITWLLLQLDYTFIGVIIFFVFLSLVLLFGYRVRFAANELKVTGSGENIFEYLLSNLSLPFLSAGVYLSKGLAKINIFTVILDFLIEAPLKTIIEVFEEWTSFIREKREEVVEVPQ